jgi:hypothetical protein
LSIPAGVEFAGHEGQQSGTMTPPTWIPPLVEQHFGVGSHWSHELEVPESVPPHPRSIAATETTPKAIAYTTGSVLFTWLLPFSMYLMHVQSICRVRVSLSLR